MPFGEVYRCQGDLPGLGTFVAWNVEGCLERVEECEFSLGARDLAERIGERVSDDCLRASTDGRQAKLFAGLGAYLHFPDAAWKME